MLVTELAERARTRSARNTAPSIVAVMNRAQVAPEDRPAIEQAYRILCSLHDERRNHIWGYYIRNLSRPIWLSQAANRADRLVGNPPWLRYNAMSGPLQRSFRLLAAQRGLWLGGAAVVTSQDLAGLFIARSTELYLKQGGRFGFVVPASMLSRSHYAGFRSGAWSAPTSETHVALSEPWDLTGVAPEPFPVPAAVIFGHRTAAGAGQPLAPAARRASGNVNHHSTRHELDNALPPIGVSTAI
jgi:hypothetical protein